MTSNQFALKVQNRVLYFDTDGEVWDALNQVGTWTTNAANEIVLTTPDGTATPVPVRWRFDADNYLWLDQGDTPVHQFGGEGGPLAKFTLRDNLLAVDPDVSDANDFTFALHPQWGLLPDGRLQVTLGGTVSQINGWLQSSDSGFDYCFVQLDAAATPQRWTLKFTGKWEQVDAPKATSIVLRFRLKDPALEDPAQQLQLPRPVGVNPKRNHLEFRFNGNNKSHLIEFKGTFKISKGQKEWLLAFTVQQSKDGQVTKSVVTVEATFDFGTDFGGNAVFYVGRVKGPGSQAISIGGKIDFRLSSTSGLSVTFDYGRFTGTKNAVATLAVGGRFYWKSDNEIAFKYQRSGQSYSVEVSAKVALESVDVTVGARLENDPQQRRVSAFMRIAF